MTGITPGDRKMLEDQLPTLQNMLNSTPTTGHTQRWKERWNMYLHAHHLCLALLNLKVRIIPEGQQAPRRFFWNRNEYDSEPIRKTPYVARAALESKDDKKLQSMVVNISRILESVVNPLKQLVDLKCGQNMSSSRISGLRASRSRSNAEFVWPQFLMDSPQPNLAAQCEVKSIVYEKYSGNAAGVAEYRLITPRVVSISLMFSHCLYSKLFLWSLLTVIGNGPLQCWLAMMICSLQRYTNRAGASSRAWYVPS